MNSQRDIDTTIQQVIEFLCQKAMDEQRQQNKYNPTNFGGVIFWFEEVPTGKKITHSSTIGIKDGAPEMEMHLKFSVHPHDWKIKEIINDLNLRERQSLINKGVGIKLDY